MKHSILVVDNEERMCKVIRLSLEMEGFEVDYTTSGEKAIELVKQNSYSLIISDLKMKPVDGITLLKKVKHEKPDTEFILMTAYASQETAVAAMKEGAADYLIKPFEMDELIIRMKRILKHKELQEENVRLKRKKTEPVYYESIVGKSQAMQKVYQLIEKVKDTDATVLIRGQSGTGKELIARAIHDHSIRKDKPFISVNCAALPDTLLESELFGYEKGAFTGAVKSKPGKFELAEDGTIFLDEIGEMNVDTQAKLLRVLEDKSYFRLGGVKPIQMKARVIAATNRHLEEMVEQKKFREDLFFRLNTFPVYLPTLAERKEDIPDLVWYFLQKYGEKMIDKQALKILMEYDWPGNVRELQNVIYRASIIAEEIITVDDLPAEIKQDRAKFSLNSSDWLNSGKDLLRIPENFQLDAFEKKLIVSALEQANGNKTEAARLLGITRRRLYSLMDKHQIRF
jgi:two-component system response regulator AtoC